MATVIPQGGNALFDLMRTGQRMEFSKGDIILRGDLDKSDSVYLVEEGFIKAYSLTSRGEEYVHILYGKGEMFPWGWIGYQRNRSIYYEPLTDCVVYRYSSTELLRRMRTDLALANDLLLKIGDLLLIYIMRVENLEYKYTKERLAYRLLAIARRFGTRKLDGSYVINIPLSQQTIANAINASRESVSREMERLQQKGILEYDRRLITIKDPMALSKVVDSKNAFSFLE